MQVRRAKAVKVVQGNDPGAESDGVVGGDDPLILQAETGVEVEAAW